MNDAKTIRGNNPWYLFIWVNFAYISLPTFYKFPMRHILIFLLFLAPSANYSLCAQNLLSDDFSGSSVTTNNAWQGNLTHFTISANQELQLNAPTAGVSSLALPYAIDDSLQFSGSFRMDFSPSLTNILQIWLAASTADLSTSDGYFIEIGENGNADALKLMKRSAGIVTIVSSAIAGAVANQPAQARYSLAYTRPGEWALSTDYQNGQNLITQFTTSDASIALTGTQYFGFHCIYTDTRKDKYFFDDVQVQRLRPDTKPPVAVSASFLDATRVLLTVNEPVTLTNTIRADANPGGLTTPNVAISIVPNSYIATFSSPFVIGTNYTIRLSSASDLLGNIADTLVFNSQYIQYQTPDAQDVIFNEIMPDPTPAVGLPEVEYVELFNRSTKYIRGEDLLFRDGTSAGVKLTGVLLLPGDKHVLVGVGAGGNLPQAIKYTEISGLPTLNNDGELLMLTNAAGVIIDQIDYKTTWYQDAVKSAGGWSLERINPDLPCSSAQNWSAGKDVRGGSPGIQNSIFSNSPDVTAPLVTQVLVEGNQQLRVQFSESLDATKATERNNWLFTPALTVAQVTLLTTTEALVTLVQPIQGGTLYQLNLTGVSDCSGNLVPTPSGSAFGLPEIPKPSDLVFNEFLFNPSTGGSRFVELTNQSNKFIDLKNCRLGGGTIGDVRYYTLAANSGLLLPDSLIIFTPEPADILSKFPDAQANKIIDNTVPTLPDDAGTLMIQCLDQAGWVTIDSFDYRKTWHNPFLGVADQEGVSLEKVGKNLPSVLSASWASAARPYNGTPTLQNSQSGRIPVFGSMDELIQLPSNRLSPDGDGFEDFLTIQYKTPKPDYFGTVKVYNSEGQPVKTIVSADLFGSEGILRWDGDDDDGDLQRPGIYLLFIELVSPEGEVLRSKHAVTLIVRF
jgi:hypothetical protein